VCLVHLCLLHSKNKREGYVCVSKLALRYSFGEKRLHRCALYVGKNDLSDSFSFDSFLFDILWAFFFFLEAQLTQINESKILFSSRGADFSR
jgi:hypothetical protein